MATANDLAQNMALRQALLQSAPRMRKKIGTYTESSAPEGKTTRIKLFNVGVITMLRLVVTANITIATANGTASPKAPWNVIKNIKFTDFTGTDRINLSGFQLWVLNSVRRRTPAHINNEGLAAVSTMPVVPTAQATADIKFYIDVPFAFNPENDLRGAILAQSNNGEMWLNITWNDDFHQNGNDDGVYNGGATSAVTVNSIAVDVYQDYLLPQSIGGNIPLPLMDLYTIYELNGNFRITDNMSNGQERLVSYPNQRSVLGMYLFYLNNGAMSNSIDQIRMIANGNNILLENSLDTQLAEQREWFNGDLKTGVFLQLHRSRLIETALYGNVQMGVKFSAAPTGVYYLEQLVESFIPLGSVLPGINTQG